MNPRITSIGLDWIYVTIPDTNINQNNEAFVWYTINLVIFAVPADSPASVQTLTAMIYSNLGGNYFSLTNTTYTLRFNTPSNFTSTCFYDPAKTIRDKIHLVPSLVQVAITNPYFVNLTSPKNWEYDWNSSTVSLPLEVLVSTYVSNAMYVVVQVVGFCPNSYAFWSRNISISVSANNWFRIEKSLTGSTRTTSIDLTTPSTGDLQNMVLGIALNGIVLQDNAFPQLLLSANLTSKNDIMNQAIPSQANVVTYSLMPEDGYGVYWMMGMIDSCQTNFDVFNATHCHCNPAQKLTYDPIYSTYRCREACPFGFYFNYLIGSCLSCQISFSFLCSTCNSTTCFNCTNGLTYYLKNTTVLCLDCAALYGQLCTFCSDKTCLTCSNNYTSAASGSC